MHHETSTAAARTWRFCGGRRARNGRPSSRFASLQPGSEPASSLRRTPPGPLPSMNPLERWAKKPETPLRATWLGHSTVLLEMDGLRVLTDPVWGERASPVGFAGPKRFQPIPVPISALPALDAVVISHDHYDHLDYPTIRELARLEVPFFTSLGVGA